MTNKTTFLIPLSALSRELSRSQSFDQPFTVLASAFRFLFFAPNFDRERWKMCQPFQVFLCFLGGVERKKEIFCLHFTALFTTKSKTMAFLHMSAFKPSSAACRCRCGSCSSCCCCCCCSYT